MKDKTNGGDARDDIMTNLTIKTNLLAIMEDYLKICNDEYRLPARKTVVLAIKAIDAYGKQLDEE